jgi:tRNA(adenine34) deaminase
MRELQTRINGCGEPLVLEGAGHFVQEQGEQIAHQAVHFFKR